MSMRVVSLISITLIISSCADAPEATLTVLRMPGVQGSPVEGEQILKVGEHVDYSFSALNGHDQLQVLLDGEPIPNQGTLVMKQPHTLIAAAWPKPTVPLTTAGRSVMEVFKSPSPATAYENMLGHMGQALLEDDKVTLEDMRKAEYAALLEVGPEGLERVSQALAGRTYEFVGSLQAPAQQDHVAPPSTMSAPDSLFTQEPITPTTIIFVNGILNFHSAASKSAEAVLDMVREQGFPTATFQTNSRRPRPGTPIRILLHHNPMVSVQMPFRGCLSKLAWAFNVAGVAAPEQHWWAAISSLWYRLSRLVEDRACLSMFSTNFRVAEQYLDANLGQMSFPDYNDIKLTSLIETERSAAGGRNVIVIGHSHGSVIARSAVGMSAEPSPNAGCVGAIALGSPLGTHIQWPRTQALHRIIAKGTRPGSWDVLYPLGGSNRTDGIRSRLTDELDREIDKEGVGLWIPWKFRLHNFLESYMSTAGLRNHVSAAFKAQYSSLGEACSGQLTGIVADHETGQMIQGARVQSLLGGQSVGATVQTSADGRFITPKLLPILHDLVISAPGYDIVTLSQRLVPFNTDAPAQTGPIYLAKKCSGPENCIMNGTYRVFYILSGTHSGRPVSCAFQSQVTLVQNGLSFQGTIRTNSYQQGCEMGSSYIYWNAGTSSMAGTIQGSSISFVHDGVPVLNMTGSIFSSGFRATEPAWRGGGYNMRVEMTASRISSSSLGMSLSQGAVVRQAASGHWLSFGSSLAP